MYDYRMINNNMSNIKFKALEDKGMVIRNKIKNPWALKNDTFINIGNAYDMELWSENDDCNSHVWKNERTGEYVFDERIWNNGLELIFI